MKNKKIPIKELDFINNKKNVRLIIHVGFPKTGTTFLQKNVFPNIKNVNFIRRPNFEIKIMPNKVNIISDESLCRFPIDDNKVDGFTVAQYLKTLFPNAKIIVGIRDKKSYSISLYNQYVKEGYAYSYDRWYKETNMDNFDFKPYINYLKNLFSDVYVYNFEDLKSDTMKLIKKLCVFIEVDVPEFNNKTVNPSLTEKQLILTRFFNKFFKNKRNPNGLFPEPYFLDNVLTILEKINKKS